MTLQVVRIGSDKLEIWRWCKRMVTQADKVEDIHNLPMSRDMHDSLPKQSEFH
jgi:hypothetical protein